MKRKIIIINRSLVEAGAEKQSVMLASILQKQYKVTLVILYDIISDVNRETISNNDLKVVVLNGDSLFIKAIDFYKLLKTNKPHIVFSYLASGNLFNALIGSISGVKYRIGGIRNAELSSKKLPFERVFHNYFLTKTISNSHSAVSGLSKLGFKGDKFHVIHNAFELNQSYILRTENNTVNIISLARFVPQKDYFTAIEAIKLLSSKMESIENKVVYYLIGYGEMEQAIRDKVKELGLEGLVKIIIKPNNLVDYFKKADVFLSTSLFEGMSNSVMEALSFSLPVVATSAGDMEYLVKDDFNGYICDIGDYNQISDRLEMLVRNYDLRKAMGEKSYQIISENFSMEKFRDNYITFIENLN